MGEDRTGFLRKDDDDHQDTTKSSTSVKDSAHVIITTSLLSRGLDLSPLVKHVFIMDEPRISYIEQVGLGELGRMGNLFCLGR